MTPAYRPDIDGLRALAVCSVILGHFGFGFFSGGYVGVDIFFVISGFLITTIIVREIEDGSFKISNFYERRFRRILPAAIFVAAITVFVGWYLLDKAELDNLLQSAIANNLFLSNVFFYVETGYFDTRAELKPLLHTWSLAVEEQYYVVMPLLLLVLARFANRRYLPWLIGIAMLSFLVSAFGVHRDPSAAFYLLPARAWELLVGSLLAIVRLRTKPSQPILEALALAGLAMMLTAILGFDEMTTFPGSAALLPVIGAALVIFAGSYGSTLTGRALSFRPIVFVGLISYSLYLWHWPALVYAKYLNVVELPATTRALMIPAVFAAAWLSWRFVEAPFRRKKLLPTKRSILTASGIVIFVFVAASVALIEADEPEWNHWGGCEEVVEKIADGTPLCTVGVESEAPSFILWGDSHARALAPAIDRSAKRVQRSGQIATLSACPPLLGVKRLDNADCAIFNQTVIDHIASNPNLKTVIVGARWGLVENGTRYKSEEGSPVHLVDAETETAPAGGNLQLLDSGLRRTLEQLSQLQRRIVLVAQVPEVGFDVRSATQAAIRTDRDVNDMIAPTLEEFLERNAGSLALFEELESLQYITVIRPHLYLCDASRCRVATEDAKALYRDEDHLSIFGATYVSPNFDDLIKSLP